MQDALEDLEAPVWTKNFWAVEETRVNDGEREGKYRRRIDIEIIEHRRGPRPRFRFEAKRLRDSDSRREYLGHDGLGCFLDGRYAASDPDAGMLGYVQEGKAADHVSCDIRFPSEGSRSVQSRSRRRMEGTPFSEGTPDLCLVAPKDGRIARDLDISHVAEFSLDGAEKRSNEVRRQLTTGHWYHIGRRNLFRAPTFFRSAGHCPSAIVRIGLLVSVLFSLKKELTPLILDTTYPKAGQSLRLIGVESLVGDPVVRDCIVAEDDGLAFPGGHVSTSKIPFVELAGSQFEPVGEYWISAVE